MRRLHDCEPIHLHPQTLEVLEVRRTAQGASVLVGHRRPTEMAWGAPIPPPIADGIVTPVATITVHPEDYDRILEAVAQGKRVGVRLDIIVEGEG